MEMWTEIRRKVFVEGASKRSIRRDYRVTARTLEKILANAEPPAIARALRAPSRNWVSSSGSSTRSCSPIGKPRPSSVTPP